MIDVVIVSTDSKHCNHYKHVVKDTSDLTTFQDLFETVSNATWSPYYPNEPPVSVKRVVVLASEDIGKDVYKLAAEIHLRVVKQECNTVKKLLPRSMLSNSGWKHIRLGPNGYFDIKKDLEPVGDLEDKWKRLLDIHKKTVLNPEFNFRMDSIFMPIDPKNPKYGAQAILCRGNIPPVSDEIVPGKFSTDDIPDANGRMAWILQYPSAKKELEWKV
ncbi:Protein of unknown function [Pyronema omphalodes CBS 100304]|uniref:Uncharacterized protein n=1 Tax=Pyronema omphalodes (strain CBS 100304) TaxID=1076935 RepID=U4KZT3_PYROM|nr:Protein of unknown function [Pyronema omphalodes CBS 100304]